MKWIIMLLASGMVAGLANAERPAQNSGDEPTTMNLNARPTTPETVQAVLSQMKNDGENVGIGRQCHVDSRVAVSVRVYINGQYRGTMAPFGDLYPIVGDFPEQITSLYAVSVDGRFSWTRSVGGSVGNYHWVLVP